ncbi:hypothetical protein K431DRAFT_194278, partial [Polychaeton citri CBS 116435]
PSPEKLQQLFDNGIWYTISLWDALHTAIQNGWGGEDSLEKKDWFAGVISELFTQRRDTDQEDVECVLLQIMQDEFDCNVEDESEVEIAKTIMGLRKSLMDRDMAPSMEMEKRWKNRGQLKSDIQDGGEIIEEVDDDDWDGGDGDVEMDEEPPKLVPVVERPARPEPEVDDDGFTKVAGKKKR